MVMTKNYVLLMLLSTLLYVSAQAGIAAEKGPPSSADIHKTLEGLWGGGSYKGLAEYVREINAKWPGYVPVKLTLAIYSFQYGAQVEDSLLLLKKLREDLSADISIASPVFIDLLDSRIARYERLNEFYLQNGISREQRLAERNPLEETSFKHSNRWVGGDENLYFTAPEVFISNFGGRDVANALPEIRYINLEKLTIIELESSISDVKKTMPFRKAAVRELVQRRAAAGAGKLVQSLGADDSLYTHLDAVDELVKLGALAIPDLVAFINDPNQYSGAQRIAIWALVRIGVADNDVVQTLQSIINRSNNPALPQYAKHALLHLQRAVGIGSSPEG
jgi:hypothetical protein